MHKRSCFWKPFRSERVNESQKLLKSAENNFYPTFSSFGAKLNQKMLFLVIFETLRLLVNKLTANYEYSRCNRENASLPIQTQLSSTKTLSQIRLTLICNISDCKNTIALFAFRFILLFLFLPNKSDFRLKGCISTIFLLLTFLFFPQTKSWAHFLRMGIIKPYTYHHPSPSTPSQLISVSTQSSMYLQLANFKLHSASFPST